MLGQMSGRKISKQSKNKQTKKGDKIIGTPRAQKLFFFLVLAIAASLLVYSLVPSESTFSLQPMQSALESGQPTGQGVYGSVTNPVAYDNWNTAVGVNLRWDGNYFQTKDGKVVYFHDAVEAKKYLANPHL